jgi:hypothetical protein
MVGPCRQGQELLAGARVVATEPAQPGVHCAGAERDKPVRCGLSSGVRIDVSTDLVRVRYRQERHEGVMVGLMTG